MRRVRALSSAPHACLTGPPQSSSRRPTGVAAPASGPGGPHEREETVMARSSIFTAVKPATMARRADTDSRDGGRRRRRRRNRRNRSRSRSRTN